MKKQLVYWLTFGLLMFIACKKEVSFETGNNPSDGSLQADVSGDCLPKTINGTYVANTALASATNTISVGVNVNAVGNFLVYTDTVNGYYFRASGTFTALGAQNVILRGFGTPFAAGVDNFVVHYDSTQCDIQVTVLPAGTGSAVFTLSGSPGSCSGANVTGTYAVGTALNSTTNIVSINVNVTTIGTYAINTTFQGMTFTANGAFTTTGTNIISLVGSGTPTTAGPNTIPLTAGSSSCNFVVNVIAGAVGTLAGAPTACTPINVAGTYTIATPVVAANTATVTVNFTQAGPYTITTDTIGGVWFNKTGTATVGTTTVVLDGHGTPTGTAGSKTFTVKFGTSSCTFTVNFLPGAGGAAVFTLAGAPNACASFTVNGPYFINTALTTANTVQVQLNVTTAGTWNVLTTAPVAGMTFSGSGTVATGNQTITLTGTGTPSATGPQTFTVSNGAGSNCTFVINVLSTDYYPRVAGNNWSYEQDDVSTDSLLRYVIPATHVALGNTYNIFLSNDGSGPDSSGYYRRNGNDYFEWFDAADYIGYTQPLWAEYIMLKDAAVGTNWKSSGFAGTTTGTPPQNLNIRFSYTVVQRPASLALTTSLGTKTYYDVIVVEEKFEAELAPGVWTDITSQVGSFKSYYAKGVGFIKFEQFDGTGTQVTQLELRRFVVF
jgi:hypothetical protein